MCSKASEIINEIKISINTVLLFLLGPFKANPGFVYLRAVSFNVSWFETDSEFLEKKSFEESSQQYTRKCKMECGRADL